MLRHVHVCCITKENKGKYLDNFLKCEFKVVFFGLHSGFCKCNFVSIIRLIHNIQY